MKQTEVKPRNRRRLGAFRLIREEPFYAPEDHPSCREPLTHPHRLFKLMQPYAARESVEVFWSIPLDTTLKPLVSDPIVVGIGIVNRVLAHAREIFRPAIVLGAYGIIVVHNHPSGDPLPSGDDYEATKKLVSAGKIIGIEVYDHVIMGQGRYTSMSEICMI